MTEKERVAKRVIARLKRAKKRGKGRQTFIVRLQNAIREFNCGSIDVYELDREIYSAEEYLDG